MSANDRRDRRVRVAVVFGGRSNEHAISCVSAGSILRNGFDLTVRDLDRDAAAPLLEAGAHWAESPAEMTEAVDILITCLPSPAICPFLASSPENALARSAPGDGREAA